MGTHHLCAAQLAVSLEAQNIAKYKIVVSYKKKYFYKNAILSAFKAG